MLQFQLLQIVALTPYKVRKARRDNPRLKFIPIGKGRYIVDSNAPKCKK